MSKYKNIQSNIVSGLKRKNIQMLNEMKEHIHTNNMGETYINEFNAFNKRVFKCANISLYKENNDTKSIDYLASHTCKSKTCFICNFLRQKSIRRKYMLWFEKNEILWEIKSKKTNQIKFTTKSQYLNKYCDDYIHVQCHKYDLMHLTLTVPHTSKGFKGEKYYFEQLKKAFHSLRNNHIKNYFWNYWVLGGEYGIEATSGSWISKETAIKKQIDYSIEKTSKSGKELVRKTHTDGLHIHIHALLFVRKELQNRNILHRKILLEWNRLTIDDEKEEIAFTEEKKQAIKKGNKTLTDEDINKINPKGATFINLETIFTIDKNSGNKIRGGNEFNSDAMKKAVLETISYHFEPMAFIKEDKSIDIQLLFELLIELRKIGEKGFRFYDKFGCLVGEKSLNIKENGISLTKDFKEVMELIVNEETGECTNSKTYFLANPANVFHLPDIDKSNEFRLVLDREANRRRINLPASTTTEAIGQMSTLVSQSLGVKRMKA